MTVDVYFTFDQIVYCLVLLLQFLVEIVLRVICVKFNWQQSIHGFVHNKYHHQMGKIKWIPSKKLPVNLHAADLLEGMIFPGKFYCAMLGICCCSDLHKMSHPNATKGELSIAYLR